MSFREKQRPLDELTMKEKEHVVKKALLISEKAAIEALMIVYDNQTAAEKAFGNSISHNGIGFNRYDDEVLSKFAKKVRVGITLSKDEIVLVKKLISKYWRQVLHKYVERYPATMVEGCKVEMLRHPTEEDWVRCKIFALNTIGKKFVGNEVTEEWKRKILKSRHSPIHTLMFSFRLTLPSYTSVHFTRHKIGIDHYVSSQRNDRQDKYDRRLAPQGEIVSHIIDVNAEELIVMANKRLCTKADVDTRYMMALICNEAIRTNPEFSDELVPMCGRLRECPEFESCGKEKEFQNCRCNCKTL